jgi:TonB family protein
MENAFNWFLLANIGFAAVWFFYKTLLQRDTFFEYTRWFMLGGIAFCLLFPLVNVWEWIPTHEAAVGKAPWSIELPTIVVQEPKNNAIDYLWISLLLYGIIGIGLASRMSYQLVHLVRLIHTRPRRLLENGNNVVYIENSAPFSFFRYIFLNPEQHSQSDLSEILQHESVHARQVHTLDILISECITCLFWMNPFVWSLRKHLRENLEYLADREVLEAGFNPKGYQYHLVRLSQYATRYSIGNSFTVSQLKKRITMMNKKESSKKQLGKYVLALPLAAALLAVSSAQLMGQNAPTPAQKTEADAVSKSSTPSKKVQSTTSRPARTVIKKKTTKQIKFTPPQIVSETPPPPPPTNETLKPEMVADKMPSFEGGETKLMQYISNNVKYPQAAYEKGVSGRVVIRFVVDENGKVNNAEVLRGFDPDCEKEAIRVVQSMPDWIPGELKGKKVPVYYTLPIVFRLQR